uniref:Uncharacterized protein n=1 Tax=Prymnesium polylepis TaxID=72548 RepID=A0A7S4MG47_9EUKA
MRTSSSANVTSSSDSSAPARSKRASAWRKAVACWRGSSADEQPELAVHKVSIDDVRPEVMAAAPSHKGASDLPAGALKFAMAAASNYPLSGGSEKGHRRIISADSVMDPFAAEWVAMEQQQEQREQEHPAAAWKDVHVTSLLDLPDDVLRALAGNDAVCAPEFEALGLTCRRTRDVVLAETRKTPLLQKVRSRSVSSLRTADVLFWQACDIDDDDIETLVRWCEAAKTSGDGSVGAPLRRLHALYLNANVISDRGVRALLDCPALGRLHHLSLASNLITDEGAMELKGRLRPAEGAATAGEALSRLHELNLRGNPLSPAARAEMKSMHDQNKMYVAL